LPKIFKKGTGECVEMIEILKRRVKECIKMRMLAHCLKFSKEERKNVLK